MGPHRSDPPLVGVDAKLDRSREHLDALKSELAAIYANPKTVHLEKRSDWEYAIVADFPPLHRLAAIAGDAIQNMRSALDYLVWELVLSGPAQPGTHTQFPIFKTRKEFVARALRGDKKRPAMLNGIRLRSQACRLIVAMQPYHTTDPDRFWLSQLALLSNIDKHHALYGVWHHAVEPDRIQQVLKWNPGARLHSSTVIDIASPLENGAELLRLTFSVSDPPPEVRVDGQFPVVPVLGDQTLGASYGAFDAWLGWLRRYVDEFRPLLA